MRNRPPSPRTVIASALGCILALVIAACATLTPPEKAAIEVADTLACDALGLIPDVGEFVVEACPTEEAAVASALASPESPPAGTQVTTTSPDAGQPVVQVLRAGKIIGRGRRRAKAHKATDAGSPVTVVALPTAPAVLPVVDAGAKDGGP